MKYFNLVPLTAALLLGSCANAQQAVPPLEAPCSENPTKQKARSEELQAIVKADQDDRKDFFRKNQKEMFEMIRQDEIRRKRVGEIFGEGCFKKAADFSAAALVYQHGIVPDHFFQTYIWAKRAVELGDASQERLMGLGVDRFLSKSGRKQLFGSQASKPGPDSKCWCLDPIEKTFPDTERKKVVGKTLAEALNWVGELNNGTSCPSEECKIERVDTPKGSIPGLW